MPMRNASAPKSGTVIFTVRFPPEQMDRLRRRAEAEQRTVAQHLRYLAEKDLGQADNEQAA